MLKLVLAFFCISFFSIELSFGQLDNGNLTEWPYGGTPDSSRFYSFQDDRPPLTFDERAIYFDKSFDGVANFRDAEFDSLAIFWGSTFHDTADFFTAVFNDSVFFEGSIFQGGANFFSAIFHKPVVFDKSVFHNALNFSYSQFFDTAHFLDIKFNEQVNFQAVRFNNLVDFSGTTFLKETTFDNCGFVEVVNLAGTDFRQKLDFRRALFELVDTIYVNHNTNFPIGDLWIYWDQFKAQDTFRIRLNLSNKSDSVSKKEHYQRLETFYNRLRDNFNAQDNPTSADAVMYELGWQKQELYGFWSWEGFKQTLYGWFFGWGYRPWKFLAFVIVPVIVGFAGLWYGKFYTVLENAIYQNELETATERIGSQEGSVFLKVWHSVLFSASALLGLRFQKAWILKHKSFLFWVTLEWVVGIGLFVLFAVLVKSNQFEYIKGLLGF